LAAAAMGLGTVPRAMMDRDAVKKALNLGEKQLVVLNHPIGYPNE
jgi:nitroreductase